MEDGLDLRTLASGAMPGLTPRAGGAMMECAAVCLEHNGHSPGGGTALALMGDLAGSDPLDWEPSTEQSRRTHADGIRAAEDGAYGVALAVLVYHEGLQAIERSMRGDHVDWWLGEVETDAPFQRKARVEVSGILRAGGGQLAARVAQKVAQAALASGELPTRVAVVDFAEPAAHLQALAAGSDEPAAASTREGGDAR